MFNSVKHTRAPNSFSVRHSSERETPTPIYVALKIHAITHSRNLIDALFNLGMCISYDRLLNLTSDISNTICEQYRVDGIVCPPKLRCGVHTSAAVDNLDYNPTSSTAKDSFYGTGISLIQHLLVNLKDMIVVCRYLVSVHLGLLFLCPHTTQMCHRHISRQRNLLHLLLVIMYDLIHCRMLKGQKKERSNGLPVLWQLSAKRNWTTQIGSPGPLIMQASKQMKFHLLQSMHCYHYSQRVRIQLP